MTKWYSSKLRIALLIEGSGIDRMNDSVFLFRSSDFETAFRRAVEIGKKQEVRFVNANGRRARYALFEILSLDCLGNELLDELEVHSEPILRGDPAVDFEAEFFPDKSTPTQTV